MRNVLIGLAIGLFLAPSFGQNSIFRKVEWGASSAAVKQMEQAQLVSNDTMQLVYESALSAYDAKLFYDFSLDDHLMGAKYKIVNHFDNPKKYFQEFEFITELLTEKYGQPKQKFITTVKGVTESDPSVYLLFKEGKFSEEIMWQTPDSDIKLLLTTVDNIGTITIEYLARKYHDLNLIQKKARLLQDL